MPNQSRSSSRKPATRKTSSSNKSTKSTRSKSSKSASQTVANSGSSLADILYIARNTLAGRILSVALLLLIVFGLNLLISMNRFDRFFTLFGVELVIGILAFWAIYLFRERNKDNNEEK